ncbi:MAG TPA: hypothetical protein VMR21_09385 [Vicinamibacteria bacterium]|nr:hypothetical protein [Vicinamibacteria bacterium]
MPPMSDQPITLSVLAQFHRDVIVPDAQRIVEGSERRLIEQIARLWDALLGTRERLETQYVVIKGGIARVEDRLERLDQRLARVEERGTPDP